MTNRLKGIQKQNRSGGGMGNSKKLWSKWVGGTWTVLTPSERRVNTLEQRKRRNYWVTMDPRVKMAFFISSTSAAENLNTGETDACSGN